MSKLPNAPLKHRHSLLFELVRQKNHANELTERRMSPRAHVLSANEMIKLQKVALRSLQAQP